MSKKIDEKFEFLVNLLKKNEICVDGETLSSSLLDDNNDLTSSSSSYEASFIDDRSENSLSETFNSRRNTSHCCSESLSLSNGHKLKISSSKKKARNSDKVIFNRKRLRRVIDDDTDELE